MSGFNAPFEPLLWDDIHLGFGKIKAADVERALANPKRTIEDFIALISPAAAPYLEPMAQQAYALTRQRFGHAMQLFVPLYLSNLCANDCTYCGFSMSNAIKRKTLSLDEIEQECVAIKQLGFEHILLVTGEHKTKVGMDYFRQALPKIKGHFAHLGMEVQPLSQAEYAELNQLGLDSVLVYQETYHPASYAQHHLKGNKQDFAFRLETPDRLGRAGIDKIGLGVLLGLADWRTDSVMMAMHLRYLQKHYWRSRYSVGFPRLRPCAGGLEQIQAISDRELVQLICAWRLFDPELELSLSTRESPAFRDQLAKLGITTMSAESRTQPGGYASGDIHVQTALEQFATEDKRSVSQITQALMEQGLQPVWKDWQPGYASQ